MQKRQVPFSAFINLLKERRPFSILGILFPLFAILGSIVIGIVLNSNKQSYENYDYEKIVKKGVEQNAVVTNIENANININGKNVKIITYEYNNDGQKVIDQFKTLEADKITDLKTGVEIKIKSLENQSVLKDIKPFVFPIQFILIVPSVFLMIGIPFLLMSVIPSLRNYNLYKNGVIKEAEIVSMEISTNGVLTNGITSYRSGAQKIIIHYFFIGKNGEKIFGKSSTTDFLTLNEKKSGDKIKIFVSENDQNKSCLIPKLEALKNNWKI